MSWLYSIVFAGLIFSANGDVPSKSINLHQNDVSVRTFQADETEKFEQSYPLSPNGRVGVSNVNGSIIVEAWDKNEVRLEAIKPADTKEALADVRLKIDSTADAFRVEADYDIWRGRHGDKSWRNNGKLEVQFHLWVPRTAVLDEVETVNGSVTVSNFTNLIKVSAVNGNVSAANLRGTARLSTVNGEVTADFDQLDAGSKISLDTVNGRATLVIPSDANATIKADSLNGNITNDFGLVVRKGKYVGRDMYGKIGSGDTQIKLSSVNGALAVRRKSDGKAVSPVTNLLPQKSNDDDDWDNDQRESLESARVNLEIAKSIKEASKAAEEGARIAQVEAARITPLVIDKIRIEALNKVNIDEAEIQRKIKQGLKQAGVLAEMRTAEWMTGGAPFIEKKSNTIAVKGVPNVSIEANDCAVRVRGWDRGEVKYVLTQLAVGPNRTSVDVAETVTESGINIKVLDKARTPGDFHFFDDSETMRLEIFVPKRSDLKVITKGEIRLSGVTGKIELNGVDEAINIRDAGGKLTLSSNDSEVRVVGFNGDLNVTTGDGDVYLEGNFSSIMGNSADGSFILTIPQNQNADVTANIATLRVEDLNAPTPIKNEVWRFGVGGPKYIFRVGDGQVRFRSAASIGSAN